MPYCMNSTFKCRNFFIILMYKAAKYALDFMFLFMLIVSIILFGVGLFVDIHGPALDILPAVPGCGTGAREQYPAGLRS